jgi:hypothetical protein
MEFHDDVRLWWFFWLMVWWQKISEATRLLKELSNRGLWNCLLHLSKLSCKNWATWTLCETELLSADAGFGVLKELSNLNLVKCFLKMMFNDFGCVRKFEQFWTCEKCFLQMSDLVHVLEELRIDLDFVEMASGRRCIWKVCQKEWSNLWLLAPDEFFQCVSRSE